MEKDYYFTRLYPLQDKVLKAVNDLNTGFYLSGGTASSRGYLHHRFSDDIDLFVNDDNRFGLWAERVIHALTASGDWQLDILLKDARFVRLSLVEKDILLKIELINDVPSHIGAIRPDAILGKLDSPENILANKVIAVIDRQEPKDLADIWGFCCKMGLSLNGAITDAHSKAAGIFPADLARVLCSATTADWEMVRWIDPPDSEAYLQDLHRLGDSLILR